MRRLLTRLRETSARALAIPIRPAAVVAVAARAAAPAGADCVKDIEGEVWCGAGRCARDQDGVHWCSRFDDGGADTNREGVVLCGRGECARTWRGNLYCSAVEGGAVLKDSRGQVRCEGRCEPARAEHCERTRADTAGP